MLKYLQLFASVFLFVTFANAVELGFQKNTANPEVGGPFVVTIDGSWRFQAPLYGKLIACLESFSTSDRQALLEILQTNLEKMKASQEILTNSRGKYMFWAVTQEEFQAVEGSPLKACLSK